MILVHESDHVELAKARMPQHRQPRARIMAFVEAVACSMQEAENQIFSVIMGGTLLNSSTTLGALRRWGQLLGEQQGSLTRTEYLQIIELRIRTNIIGTEAHPNNFAGYLALLVDLFAPSAVSVSMFPGGSPAVSVTVSSGAAPLSDAFKKRGGRLASLARPIGLLLVITEILDTSFRYDTSGLGYDQGLWWADRIYDGNPVVHGG